MRIKCIRPEGWDSDSRGGRFAFGEVKDLPDAVAKHLLEVQGDKFVAESGESKDAAGSSVAAPAKGMSEPPRSKPFGGKTK